MTTPSHGDVGTGEPQKVPLSQLIHLMAEYQKLGTHRQTFLPAPASDTFVRGCGIVAGGFAAVGVICVTVGAYPGALAIGLIALIPASLAFLRGRHNRRHRAARLDLFDSGMTVYRSGEQVAGFRWDSAEVRQQVIPFQNSAPTEYSLRMTGPDGADAAFDDSLFGDAREWGRAIQSAVTLAQLPRAAATIDDTGTVHFGEIALDLTALYFRSRAFAWEQIQLIDARSGLARMKVDGNWVSLTPVGQIPNFYIFNELAERLRLAAAAESAELESATVTPVTEHEPPADTASAVDPEPVSSTTPAVHAEIQASTTPPTIENTGSDAAAVETADIDTTTVATPVDKNKKPTDRAMHDLSPASK
ncbi:hypothetical protein OG874_31890 [Nocardia sp. NBC_00565]|uniref:DUF6585 family protein n=1 Tax=Nocardia sp. NBC_00565 TaxID=2975993 RepID=UPI002E7FDD1D|nr:DUF6585 family protein [Nocardia sp. NBC_00565]WUC01372.1 hypothetical protein OG874_31890 [Nocardia sp. NBC_00565]